MNAFTPPPSTIDWKGLENLGQLPLPVLAEFIQDCSKDTVTRTAAVTLLVTSLCQLAGRSMTARMPSAIMINAHDLVPDPTALLASRMIKNPPGSEPRVHQEGDYMYGTPANAPEAMANAITRIENLGKVTTRNASIYHDLENRYFAAQRTGFGFGPSRAYAEAWHDIFGLLTDSKDEVILRIDEPQDRAAFRNDIIGEATSLRQPLGYGRGLQLVPKHIALSGSLPASQWDAPLAKGIVELALPLLMIPSVAKAPPEIPNEQIFDFIATSLPGSFQERVEEPANLIPTPWFEGYGLELRKRLRYFPGDYDYTMQKLARQFFPVSLRIANWCGRQSGSSTEEVDAVTFDLCAHAIRGLVWSIAGLSWHGLGFDAGCSQQKVTRVLEYLREREPMTKSELLRGAHLRKEERDLLLETFEAEGLIRVDERMITATSYAEFVELLHTRDGFPEPRDHWGEIANKGSSAA